MQVFRFSKYIAMLINQVLIYVEASILIISSKGHYTLDHNQNARLSLHDLSTQSNAELFFPKKATLLFCAAQPRR